MDGTKEVESVESIDVQYQEEDLWSLGKLYLSYTLYQKGTMTAKT